MPAGGANAGTVPGGAADNGSILTGFEDLEAVLSPETAAASKAAAAAAAAASANDTPTNGDIAAPAAGVSLLGGLVTAKSKVSTGQGIWPQLPECAHAGHAVVNHPRLPSVSLQISSCERLNGQQSHGAHVHVRG